MMSRTRLPSDLIDESKRIINQHVKIRLGMQAPPSSACDSSSLAETNGRARPLHPFHSRCFHVSHSRKSFRGKADPSISLFNPERRYDVAGALRAFLVWVRVFNPQRFETLVRPLIRPSSEFRRETKHVKPATTLSGHSLRGCSSSISEIPNRPGTMAIPSPVYGLIVPFLCVVTLPLAIFAGITATLAFSVLMFRVLVVYLDIALSLLPQYLMGRSPQGHRTLHSAIAYQTTNNRHVHNQLEEPHSPSVSPTGSERTGRDGGHNTPPMIPPPMPLGYITPDHHSPTRTAPHAHFASGAASMISPSAGRRSRRSSLGGNGTVPSIGTITAIKEGGSRGSEGVASGGVVGSSGFLLLGSHGGGGVGGNAGIVRDFEGVGGWRLLSDDRDDDDSDWARVNSRLELPLERMSKQQQQQQHHHYRSPSGSGTSPVTPGEGSWLMMKNTRKAENRSSVSHDGMEREADAGRRAGPSTAGPFGRAIVPPNSSRARSGQGIVAFTGIERGDGFFPSAESPSSARKAL